MNGQSFASKIGNPYDAKLGLFGLPSKNVDVKSIGWSNAKFVKLTGDDKSDLRFRFYNPSNNNVGVGNSIDNYDPVKNHSGLIMYMPISNLGENYAAMFMVDDEITTYGTPSAEEMLLVPLPGGNYSFDISYDADTETYWLAPAEDTDSHRTRVSLYYSYIKSELFAFNCF